ncbi:MAG: GAF domain-containing protein [Pseudomonadota bacterium]|jgi:GAF domain-containing protein
MKDHLAEDAVAQGDNDEIRAILEDICRMTDMGFAAVARVTDTRWIACQLLDKIAFGLQPGDELEIQTTICNDIRQSGQRVVIDHVDADIQWQTHHTPIMYGFKSYASFPIFLPDGSFFGTLCAIDPHPRAVSGAKVIATMEEYAKRIAQILGNNQTQAG